MVAFRMRATTDDDLQTAQQSYIDGDNKEALAAASRVLRRDSKSTEALLIAGGASASLGEVAQAIEYIDRLPASANRRINDAHALAANLTLFELGRASDAEQRFRAILSRDPQHLPSLGGLAGILGLAGRRQEAIPVYQQLIRLEHITADQLTLLGAEFGAHRNDELHRLCLEAVPDDPVPLLGLAWAAAERFDFAKAEEYVRRALQSDPELLEAHVMLGRVFVTQRRFGEMSAWNAALPEEAETHPEVWRLRGDWLRALEQSDAAARCYWESLGRNPSVRATLDGLIRSLHELGRGDEAEPFARRMHDLQRLHETQAVMFDSQRPDGEQLRVVAQQLEDLGRAWEARGWALFALSLDDNADWAREQSARLGSLLESDPPLTLAEFNPAEQIDLSDLALPDWQTLPAHRSSADTLPVAQSATGVRFRDVAAELGIEFRYVNGESEAGHQYEFTGGGTAVIDFDADGRPDLYFTQGCRWPPDAGQTMHLDRLFRNISENAARDVTEAAQIQEASFSQGAAVGDFDGDGFADLYVANIGANRLFRNNGDGTFSPSPVTSLDDGQWTTSCLLADLTGDGLPDLYDVNYLADADVFERQCRHDDGAPYMCPPFHFRAAQDRFLASSGDGDFQVRTSESGFEAPDGKGLGIVAFDADGGGRLSLFVANDTTANFFFLNQTQGVSPRFAEKGLERGLAFGDQGQAQSCMGVASGDLNEDGLLDLFVTNFAREYYALYQQVGPGQFGDEIRRSGIADATLPVLGFGTQTIDGDLDGRLDLIVANGHIQDERKYTGDEYQMPPQYFHNQGGGRFEQLAASELGPYFEGRYLGRSLARLDWNGDGREDFAVSHLDAPAALLVSESASPGQSLSLRLIGVHAEREAVGATIRLHLPQRTIVRQLTAGDGYQASNERLIVIGWGAGSHSARLEIQWPSGRSQSWEGVTPGQQVFAVEGRPALFEAP